MTSAEQVRNVLLEDHHDLEIVDQEDGSAVVRDCNAMHVDDLDGEQRSFPVSDTLHRCADILADAGFVIALVRDKQGVYLNAH